MREQSTTQQRGGRHGKGPTHETTVLVKRELNSGICGERLLPKHTQLCLGKKKESSNSDKAKKKEKGVTHSVTANDVPH